MGPMGTATVSQVTKTETHTHTHKNTHTHRVLLNFTSETLSVAIIKVIHVLTHLIHVCGCVNASDKFNIGML